MSTCWKCGKELPGIETVCEDDCRAGVEAFHAIRNRVSMRNCALCYRHATARGDLAQMTLWLCLAIKFRGLAREYSDRM